MDIFKILKDLYNYGEKIFVNSAGSSMPPQPIIQSMKDMLDVEAEIGGYEFEDRYKKESNFFYKAAAVLLNTKPSQIAFTTSATDAFRIALSSISFQKEDVIITTEDDYSSNQIQYLSLKERFGIEIKYLPLLSNGDIDLEESRRLLNRNPPKLLAVTHVPTNSGKVQDIVTLGEICYPLDTWYLVDACQSVGQMKVDVNQIKCDFLSATGRKFLRGPRGTGLLYASERVINEKLHPIFIDMHSANWKTREGFELKPDAKRFEQWEASIVNKIGLAQSIAYLNKLGIQNIEARNDILGSQLRNGLTFSEGVKMYDEGNNLCNIITFRKEGISLEEISQYLKNNDVFFSVSHRESGLLDFERKSIDGVIRLSPHYFNTQDEIVQLISLIDKM